MFNEANFLKSLSGLITGDGIIKEVPISLSDVIATTASDPALSSNVLEMTLAADNESLSVPFQIPLDYDESNDQLVLVLTAQLTTGDASAGSNIITLDFDQVNRIRPGDTAVEDLSSDVTSDAQSVDDVVIAQYAFDMSSLTHKVGDVLTIEIDAQETGTAVATIYGVSMRYRSDIVAFNPDTERENITAEIDNA